MTGQVIHQVIDRQGRIGLLEEARNALCSWCRREIGFHQVRKDFHVIPPVLSQTGDGLEYCRATPVRAMIDNLRAPTQGAA